MDKDLFIVFVRNQLSSIKQQLDSSLNSPEAEYQYLYGRYEAYEEALKEYERLAGSKKAVRHKFRCPDCQTEIIGDSPDAQYECGNCACQPWDNAGKDILMQYVGEVPADRE